jgi:hypothetical protein
MSGERSYGAGEDIPGTPGPFPYDLVAFGCAAGSATLATVTLFVGLPFILSLAPALGWLLFGVAGLFQGAWKGFLIGLPILLAPWVVFFIVVAAVMIPGV